MELFLEQGEGRGLQTFLIQNMKGEDSKPSSFRTKETPHLEGTVIPWMTDSFVSYEAQVRVTASTTS